MDPPERPPEWRNLSLAFLPEILRDSLQIRICLISVLLWSWRVFLASLPFSFPALIIVVLGFTSGAVSLPTWEEKLFYHPFQSHPLPFFPCLWRHQGGIGPPLTHGTQWVSLFLWERLLPQAEPACLSPPLPAQDQLNSFLQTRGKREFEQSLPPISILRHRKVTLTPTPKPNPP